MIKTTLFLSLVTCMIVTSGCGDGGAAVLKRRSNLHQLGMAYHMFYASNARGPANAAELAGSMTSKSSSNPQVADAIESLQEGDVVMIWDGVLGDSADNSRYVLGFEAGVPATGGYVVMGDGEVRLMTGKDFSQANMIPNSTGTP